MRMMRRKKTLAAVMMVALVTGCASYPVISKRDYIRVSDTELTDRMLVLTPIGISAAEVDRIIRKKLHRETTRVKMSHFGPLMREGYDFHVTPNENDAVIISTLAWYGWAENFFCAGSLVEGLWLLNQDDELIEVIVRHGSDGM